jgi:hypothetical protein
LASFASLHPSYFLLLFVLTLIPVLLGTHALRRARATIVSVCKMAINIAVEAGELKSSLVVIILTTAEEKMMDILTAAIL